MNETLKYKGYIGSVHASIEDDCLHGKIEFINDLVTYEAQTPKDLEKAFIEAVEDYLKTCEEVGARPEKPFKGSLNVRLGPDLHRKAALKAKQTGVKLNTLIVEAVQNSIPEDKKNPL